MMNILYNMFCHKLQPKPTLNGMPSNGAIWDCFGYDIGANEAVHPDGHCDAGMECHSGQNLSTNGSDKIGKLGRILSLDNLPFSC
jgi:hypothetical protein